MGGMREVLKKSDALVGVVRDLRKTRMIARRRGGSRRIRAYLRSSRVGKLQLGAGPTSLPGWLCTDLTPSSDDVVYLDVRKPFPFDDALFDYVFSEHLIEHLSWSDGGRMLLECRRVLKPGGIIRTATPDLAVLLSLGEPAGAPLSRKYVRWITDTFMAGVDVYKPQFVINNAFRDWGHQFLYDGDILELALRRAGFENVTRCRYGESTHEHLRGIESHGVNAGSEEMAVFETLVYEATRPE